MCRKVNESIDHIVSGCSKLAQNEYNRRPWKYYIGSLLESVILKLEINVMKISQKEF